MTTEDYLKAAWQLQKGEPIEIANFGLDQSALKVWKVKESENKQVKKLDHMTSIDNSKRLIAKYAREERTAWERNLKEKGIWTQAQEERSLRLAKKSVFDLYEKLENNF